MHVIPVIDLMGGLVVRGVGGRREAYRPVQSRLATRADALSVARAFRRVLGLEKFYVADLDAILHGRPDLELYRELAGAGFQIIVDAGLRGAADAVELVAAGARAVVAGLETIAGPETLERLCGRSGAADVFFSLDMKAGIPLGDTGPWGTSDPLAIAERAVTCGAARIIVLDLAQVGMECGMSTLTLCRQLRSRHPRVELVTGGGVRTSDDLHAAADAGIDGVLVATALHDGSIGRKEIEACSTTM